MTWHEQLPFLKEKNCSATSWGWGGQPAEERRANAVPAAIREQVGSLGRTGRSTLPAGHWKMYFPSISYIIKEPALAKAIGSFSPFQLLSPAPKEGAASWPCHPGAPVVPSTSQWNQCREGGRLGRMGHEVSLAGAAVLPSKPRQ